MSEQNAGKFRALFICLFLAAATLAVYWPVKNYGFVDFDDSGYFFANPHVLGGFTLANVKWACTSGEYANWHPLTWLSLMLDAEIFGNGAAAPHSTNVLLHAANSILLFLLLRQMTGTLWRSAAVAALFALHPLHVESVAWVSERKDLLSAFFGLLTLLCYVKHVTHDKCQVARADNFLSRATCYLSLFYGLTLLFFALGLMSKPMLVTLPCVMLLLDYWPLQRFNASTFQRLLLEKVPFFLLSAAVCVVTFVVQQKGGAVSTLTKIPASLRIENAFISYARYLAKTFWPVGLATPYPLRGHWPALLMFFSIALFAALCLASIGLRKKFPFALTGWFWFAGMLVPVIGLVQVGAQAMADRYAYLPLVGVFIIVIWGIAEICAKWRRSRRAVFVFGAIVFLACAVRARNQVSFWENDGILFGHALAVTKNNYIASLNLGFWYSKSGRIKEALDCYYSALRMSPDDPTALYNVGNAFAKLGDLDDAIRDYRHALQITPDQPDILDNLGFALVAKKQFAEAVADFQAALKVKPDSTDAHNNIATVFFIQGRFKEAAREFYAALQLSPDDSRIAANLGDTFVRLDNTNAAVECYRQALQFQPGDEKIRAKLQRLGVQPSN